MSAKVQGWVWDLADLLPQRRLVLLWLANRATDNGVCFPGQAEVRRKTGLGEKMVRRHLHWLASDVDDEGTPKAPLMTIIERRIDADRNTSNVYVLHVPWAQPDQVARELEELKHVPAEVMMSIQREGVAGDPQVPCDDEPELGSGGLPRPPRGSPVGGMGVAGNREEYGHRNDHRKTSTPPDPPRACSQQQRQRNDHGIREVPDSTLSHRAASAESEPAARSLVSAFYRGLGADPGTATTAIQRRDLAIARQLVEAGATPEEAETYARETSSKPGRMAPVDLRSFERERLSWRTQRRAKSSPLGGLRLVTGQGLSD